MTHHGLHDRLSPHTDVPRARTPREPWSWQDAVGAPDRAQRVALAQVAVSSSLRGAPRRQVADLAHLAWDESLVEGPGSDLTVAALLAGALLFADELERCLEILAHPRLSDNRALPSPVTAAAGFCRTWALYHQGRVAEALAAGRAYLEAASPPPAASGGILAALSACQLAHERPELAEAELAAVGDPLEAAPIDLPVLMDVRAQLRLAQGQPHRALADALAAGQHAGPEGARHPGVVAWRLTAALAHVATGATAAAERMTAAELRLASTADLTRVMIRAQRIQARIAHSRNRIEPLMNAVAIGECGPVRLEYLRALVDLGVTLRRANRRGAARKWLSRALELGRDLQSGAVVAQAEAELARAGGPLRPRSTRGVEALTRSERRVATLAAQGLTTREIGSELFVTAKTVEFHLRHIYCKLAIPSSRLELARAMASPLGHEDKAT